MIGKCSSTRQHRGGDPTPPQTDGSFRLGLILAFAALWGMLAIAPVHRADWALENLLVVAFVAGLVGTRHRLAFSQAAELQIFAFLCLHAVGAHYTYSLVPYDRWSEAMTGIAIGDRLGLDRNHYDRLVHLAYGLLLTAPTREALSQAARVAGVWRHVFAVMALTSLSAVYEIVEWAAAMMFGPDLGLAYVGAQGDAWDAQKDMALATFGALAATAAAVLCERRRAGAPPSIRAGNRRSR